MANSSFSFVMSAYNARKNRFDTVENLDDADAITAFGSAFSAAQKSAITALGFVHESVGTTTEGKYYQRLSKKESKSSASKLDSILGIIDPNPGF